MDSFSISISLFTTESYFIDCVHSRNEKREILES